MRLSSVIWGNLNAKHWHRRVWEIGYRGPLLAQRKRTGRPDHPVRDHAVKLLQERFEREWYVMKCLATPYLSKEKEAPYVATYGDFDQRLEAANREAEYKRMPDEPKKVTGYKRIDLKHGNIGNMLHVDRTVEDSLKELITRDRWD